MTVDVVDETTETNFSQFWSLGSLKQECWPIQLPSEVFYSCLEDYQCLPVSSQGSERQQASGVSSLQGYEFHYGGPILMISSKPNDLISKYHHTGGLGSTYGFGKDT